MRVMRGLLISEEGHEGTFDGCSNFFRYRTTSVPPPRHFAKTQHELLKAPFSNIQLFCSFFYFWEEVDLGGSPFPPLHSGKVVWWQLGSRLGTLCLSIFVPFMCPPPCPSSCPSCTLCPWCPC